MEVTKVRQQGSDEKKELRDDSLNVTREALQQVDNSGVLKQTNFAKAIPTSPGER